MEPADLKPVVLLLGSYHMANPNRDAFNVQADDVLAQFVQESSLYTVEAVGAYLR